MMEIEKLVEAAPDWVGHTSAKRVDLAASFLFLHGYMTSAQRSKITAILEKQFADGIADGRIVEAPKDQPND